jgi:hypothetical protein
MPTTLKYSFLLSEGYIWNLKNKIFLKTGYQCRTAQPQSGFALHFIEDLTEQEKIDINTIVGDGSTALNPIKFATQNNRFEIKDVENWVKQVETQAGFNTAISYKSSGTYGFDVYDIIVVQPCDPTYQMEYLMQGPDAGKLRGALEDLITLV